MSRRGPRRVVKQEVAYFARGEECGLRIEDLGQKVKTEVLGGKEVLV